MPAQTLRYAFQKGKTVAISLAVLITIRDYVVAVDVVKGSSMAPTLSPSSHKTGARDAVLIKRWQPAKNMQRGDIITFWKPHKPDEISIKRVVALPGDQVWPRDREMGTIGGYGGHGVRKNYDLQGKKSLVVPFGHVWVEGDNWRGSYDSNDFGPISQALVDGKAVGVFRGWWLVGIPGLKGDKGATRVREGAPAQLPGDFLD